MKIAMVAWNFNKRGGIERCLFELACELSKKHEVHVFCSNINLELVTRIHFHKIPIINRYFILKIISFFINSYFVFNRINKKEIFDIIHLHNPSLIRPNIYTLHSVHRVGIEYQERNMSFLKKYLTRLRTMQILIIIIANYNIKQKNVNLVAISKTVKNEVYKIIGNSKVVNVIYHGVNAEDFNVELKETDSKILKNKLKIKAESRIILFVANEFKRKGLDILLKALFHLSNYNWHLLVIGDSNDGFLNSNQAIALARNYNILEKCTFLGKSDNLGVYYSISDLFILPTSYEPLGMVYMEAMIAGLATIVSDIAGAAELIVDGEDAIILRTPVSISDLSNKIKTLIQDEKLLTILGSNGKRKMLQYSWAKATDEYERLYEFIIKNR